MVIDVHVHCQDRPGFLDELLSACAANDIDTVCLNGGGPFWNQVGNDEAETAFRKYPDRVIGFRFIVLRHDKVGLTVKNLLDQ